MATCPLSIHDSRYSLPEWVLGVQDWDEGEYEREGAVLPDLSIDPDDGVLSLINTSRRSKSYFVTIENCAHIISAEGLDLLGDVSNGTRRPYVTFIAVLPGGTVMDLVTLVPKVGCGARKQNGKKKKCGNSNRLSNSALKSIGVTSDVQDFIPGPPAEQLGVELEAFPLRCVAPEFPGSWLCTQASGGSLTHFAHPSTYYAIDFRCAVGTPVVAVFSGVVLEIRRESSASGVHVSNLFDFNSIMIKKNGVEDIYIEYVHISKDGVVVSVGDEVETGQVICLSGDAGFCPEPHLHMQVQRSRALDAPSVPIFLPGGAPVLAGNYYPSV